MDAGITSQVETSESVAGHDGSPVTDSETSFPSKALGLALAGLSTVAGTPGQNLIVQRQEFRQWNQNLFHLLLMTG